MKCRLSVLMARKNVERALMGDEAVTITGLAETIGVSYTTIQRMHSRAPKRFDGDVCEKICRFFECDINDLFSLEVGSK